MHNVNLFDLSRIAQDLQIRKIQVESVVQLLEEGNTVPFIARYRQDRCSGLNEEVIRHIATRVRQQKQLAERKQTILKSIESHGKLTEDLRSAILHAETSKRVEDLYLPFKPKKPGPASEARARGLEPLALAIWQRDAAFANADEHWNAFANPDKQLNAVDDVRAGVLHILAELIAEKADVRAAVRRHLWENGKIAASKSDKIAEGQGLEYKDYFSFSESLRHIPPHRILALNRGEKEHALKISIEWNLDNVRAMALEALAEAGVKRVRRRREHGRRRDQNEGAGAEQPASTEMAAPTEPAAPAEPVAAPAVAAVEAVAMPQPVDMPTAASVAPTLEFQVLPLDVGEPLWPNSEFRTPHAALLKTALDDAVTRLLLPALEREIRQELAEEAEAHSVTVLARNLRSLLLQPPLRNQRVLAIDPSFRTGCKMVALDENGNVLEHSAIHPQPPQRGHRERPRGKPRKPRPQPAAQEPKPTPAAATAPSTAETPHEQSPWATAAEMPPALQESATPADTPPPLPPMAGGQPDEGELQGAGASTAEAPTALRPAEGIDVAAENYLTCETAAAAVSTEAPPSEPAAPEPPAPEPAPAEAVVALAEPPAAAAPAASPERPPKPTPAERRAEAKNRLVGFAKKHNIGVIAIGNGSGCREMEELVSEVISEAMSDLAYVIVNEAGARIYSVSQTGREELAEFDSTVRGTISIGRRLQDPLGELVKVDPQHIGVGLYQHDVKRREFKELLEGVVESVVNHVGVDINTANVSLLRYVAGLNQMVARELVEYRKQHGPFKNRQQLLQVPGMNDARFTQAAGFLLVLDGDNPLDRMWIHPESYELASKVLGEVGFSADVLSDPGRTGELRAKLQSASPPEIAGRLNAGEALVRDIIEALAHPNRDPREELPPPIFKKSILKLEDLQPGMELKGTVLNVVDFGVFVDIGLKESGLVHISQMANRYIKSPYDVVAVNDVVSVWVLNVDHERHRVSLSMIKPGTERKPAERHPPREQQGERPPRADRRPPRGRPPGQQQGQGRPPQGRGGPRHEQKSAGETGAPPRPAAPPPPPRKPRRPVPQPKLSKAALEGKVPLRTFGELSALFAAKKEDKKTEPQPAEQAPASPPPSPETVAEPTPSADRQSS